jgi:hypothetical protein
MKTLIFLIFTLGLSVLTDPAYKDNLHITDDNVKVVFDDNLSLNDLVAIKLHLAEKDIHITYNYMNFNSLGKLKSLDYNIISNARQTKDTYDLTSGKEEILIERL